MSMIWDVQHSSVLLVLIRNIGHRTLPKMLVSTFLVRSVYSSGKTLTAHKFQAIVLSRLTYAISMWGLHLNVELKQGIDAFLKRSFVYHGFTKQTYEIRT